MVRNTPMVLLGHPPPKGKGRKTGCGKASAKADKDQKLFAF